MTRKMAWSLSQKIRQKRRKPVLLLKWNNYASKLRRQKLFDNCRNEFKSSTVHGLPYVVNDKLHWLERIFWILSVMASGILAIYLLAAQLARFIDTPTVASVEMDYFNWNISYPAFTLCPDNNFKIEDATFSALVNEYKTKTTENPEKYLWDILTASMETLDFIQFTDLALIDPRNYSALAASHFKPFDNSALTTNNNWPISVDAAMTEVGMCHVLNSNVAKYDDPLKWSNTIMAYTKNNIELSIHDRDFFTQIMNYAEIFKVYIHSPDETILSTTSSYKQSLKGFISLGVQVWSTRIAEDLRGTIIRLRKCRSVNEPINNRYNIYSYNHCLLECRIQMIITLCGCVPHFYKPLGYEKVCSLAELECVLQHKRDITSLSASEMLLIQFKYSKMLPRTSHDCKCLSQCETDIYQKDYETFIPQSNMNRLRVGISYFPRVRVIRNIMFSVQDTILKIGGVWNLCLGASLLSFMEVCMPFIKITISYVKEKLKNLLVCVYNR